MKWWARFERWLLNAPSLPGWTFKRVRFVRMPPPWITSWATLSARSCGMLDWIIEDMKREIFEREHEKIRRMFGWPRV